MKKHIMENKKIIFNIMIFVVLFFVIFNIIPEMNNIINQGIEQNYLNINKYQGYINSFEDYKNLNLSINFSNFVILIIDIVSSKG